MNSLSKKMTVGLALTALVSSLSTPQAHAQNGPHVKANASEKSTWFSAPHEFQIVDERPVIRDFRQAEPTGQNVDLPDGPRAGNGRSGGGGSGALGGGDGSTLPVGGQQIGGNAPAYRAPMNSLPKSGFGGSNIGNGGHPGGLLPAISHSLQGKMLPRPNNDGTGAGPAKGMSVPRGRTSGNSGPVAAATYSGGYGQGSGSGYGGSASRTEGLVRGTLLKK